MGMDIEFFGKSYGIFGKFFRWIGIIGALIGVLLLIFSPDDRGTGVQMLVSGVVVMTVLTPNKNPFVVIKDDSFSIRMGRGSKYQTISKTDIGKIDIEEKAFTVFPKKGKKIKIGRRFFDADTWAKLKEEIKVLRVDV